MSEPICPRDSSHTEVSVALCPESSPHYAALLCSECDEHIKWLSKGDTAAYEAWGFDEAMSAKPQAESQTTRCPLPTIVPGHSTLSCAKAACQLWWLCDSEGVVARMMGHYAPKKAAEHD